jgi:hypothetical protein
MTAKPVNEPYITMESTKYFEQLKMRNQHSKSKNCQVGNIFEMLKTKRKPLSERVNFDVI